jgi:hypothetical protein
MNGPESHAGRERWLLRAERINDAFGLVLILVLTTYVLASLLGNRGWDAVAIAATASATSVVALISSHTRPRGVWIGIGLAILAIGCAAIAAASDDRTWLNIGSLIEICLLTAAMLAVLRRVVTSAEIGFRTILGAISFYTVLGILFTYVYATVDRLQDGAFFEAAHQGSGSDFIFFSYTTLTTTGYGDLVPAAQPGRMLAGLEMMIGQIFLVTLVAGLVSLWRPGDAIRRRRAGRAEG